VSRAVRRGLDDVGMAQNFIACDREQELVLPPSLREWLPEDHLAWFVLDAVSQLDLAPFYAAYRRDGWGAAAHDPAKMVALLVYAYAIGERSARGIERRCREDVAFRVITANHVPDHATVARFRVRHEAELGELFGQVLGLCADAGLVSVGVVAVAAASSPPPPPTTRSAATSRSPPRSSKRPAASTRPRTSSTAGPRRRAARALGQA
jgi:transposase